MFIVIMAGGSGTRFWPASRQALPKQFLNITGSRTMLEETLSRVRPVVEDARAIFIVVNQIHQQLTENLVRDSGHRVLVEPVGRNTAACIGLAAMHIGRIDPDEPILVLPSDHFIAKPDEFAEVLGAAARAAVGGSIVTIGATPTRPETGYGYIEVGDPITRDQVMGDHSGDQSTEAGSERKCFKVIRFVEKPNAETAAGYLSSDRFLWNCGIFGFTARTILAEIKSCKPELFANLNRIGATIGTADYPAVLESVYPGLEPISIDYAVIEKTQAPLLVFPGDFGWSDVGSWQAVYELGAGSYDETANRIEGDVIAINSRSNLVHSAGDRLIALLGVEGLVIIDTEDALLVARLDQSQDVKLLPELVKRKKREELC